RSSSGSRPSTRPDDRSYARGRSRPSCLRRYRTSFPRSHIIPAMPKTLFEKIWDSHVVHEAPGEPALLYIDLHLVHEVTSPQAFDGLRLSGRQVRRPDLTVATMDHNVPTWDRRLPVTDETSRQQMDTLAQNCQEY